MSKKCIEPTQMGHCQEARHIENRNGKVVTSEFCYYHTKVARREFRDWTDVDRRYGVAL
jgi:hypothetical protein